MHILKYDMLTVLVWFLEQTYIQDKYLLVSPLFNLLDNVRNKKVSWGLKSVWIKKKKKSKMDDLTRLFDRKGYLLMNKIGKGAYGDIYLVTDKLTKQL